jgi:hypothetical protein
MADSDKQIRFAGDVDVELVQITSTNGFYQNVGNQVIGIQIFEDIFSPFITGTLIIKDSLDLLNVFPFAGEEYLTLRINTPSLKEGSIRGDFYIFKMANREIVGDRSVIYELHFITQEAIVDLNKRVSRSFSGKPSDIAKVLLEDKEVGLQLTKPINIEETNNELKFISNFWSPVKCLNYLCDHSLNKNQNPSYVFFENRNGFNFVSLEELYKTNFVVEEFTYDNFVRETKSNGDDAKNIVKDYKRIRRLAVPKVFDYVDRVQSGMIGSKQYSFDIISKNVAITNFDSLQDFPQSGHTNIFPFITKDIPFRYNSKIISHQRHFDNFTGFGDSSNAKFLQKRISLMKATDASKIEITVPGRTQYTVGQKVIVEVDKMEPDDGKKASEDTLDRMLSGAYIIGAINHFIDREKHECVMELFRDSLFLNLEELKKIP